MPTIRSFIALPIPHEIQHEMGQIQRILKDSGADVKWDTWEKFHVTLKFLGDIDSSNVDLLVREVRNSIGGFSSFDLAFSMLGAFPNVHRPRVVWIGGEENKSTLDLQQLVEEACLKCGFAKEDRRFHAHVTLGRVKSDRNSDRLTARLKSITFSPLAARCTEVHIMRSELKPSGSVYTLLNSIPLAS